MHIAIVGAGRVGSTLALHLSRAGHAVTLIARGARLVELLEDPAIETVAGERVVVRVARSIDLGKRWDLLLVAVRAPQIDELLPSLHLSAAQTILFMVGPDHRLEQLREAVGPARCAFAFTRAVAALRAGKLEQSAIAPDQITMLSSAAWQAQFAQAGIPSLHSDDIEGAMRAQAALCTPLLAMAQLARARGSGVSWREAGVVARALAQGFAQVDPREPGVVPRRLRRLRRLPLPLATAALWLASRSDELPALDEAATGELPQPFAHLTPCQNPAETRS